MTYFFTYIVGSISAIAGVFKIIESLEKRKRRSNPKQGERRNFKR